MNERKTEDLVEKRLRKLGYYTQNHIVVEKQQSDSPRIQKLLKNASKKGSGVGRPEFIIHSKTNSDFIIVIECKADPNRHISNTLDQYADYAVDGVLLYASYLVKDFDVLAIAVSGETEKELRISNYLYLKKTTTHIELSGNEILSFENCRNVLIQHPAKFQQDYDALLVYSRNLNEQLQAKKIKEAHRSMLICGILVALDNRAFKEGFKLHKTARQLADILVQTVIGEFKSARLPANRIDSLKNIFSFIQDSEPFISDKEFVVDLIKQIDENVNAFVRTHKYYDAIGQFYVQFLRYANNDKGLGIVLTPPHVAELFAELAEVNKKSIVFDNCCGTAGLLIAAMREMLKDAGGNKKTETTIKKKQLIGIEFQNDIYALAISNMVIHGDGKTNILAGDCFKLSDNIKVKWKPTVGLLNPPYKTKASPTEELDFVLNNLGALQVNGKCIAIIPISCVIGEDATTKEKKRQLLEKHTLEAVLSMPSDLFHDSKASVVTCVMVITAHKPHQTSQKTWFAYCRDDGFVKVKNKGRIDLNNIWETTKNKWLTAFRNRSIIPHFSVMKEVAASDEWCADAYLEPDWSLLTREALEKTFREYAVHKVLKEIENGENH